MIGQHVFAWAVGEGKRRDVIESMSNWFLLSVPSTCTLSMGIPEQEMLCYYNKSKKSMRWNGALEGTSSEWMWRTRSRRMRMKC